MASEKSPRFPTIFVVSDSVGVTAQSVARAAAAQFGVTKPKIETMSDVKNFDLVAAWLDKQSAMQFELEGEDRIVVYYSMMDVNMRNMFADYIIEHDNIVAVDVTSAAVNALAEVSGIAPSQESGALHVADDNYFQRIDAIEFTIEHDDGRNPHELTKADIVLLGVSRSSKTPTSIHLAQHGLKVANVPLDPQSDPPKEIYDVDPTRMFGLMISPEVLVNIRQRRLGNASVVAASYADPECVYEDLDKARALMRKLGCVVIRTENRAVEETAQEILRYYERLHPSSTDKI